MAEGGEDAPSGQWVSGNPHLGVDIQFSDPQPSLIGRAKARSEVESPRLGAEL